MIEKNQLWVWLWDEPLPSPNPETGWLTEADLRGHTGHWDVRAVGVIDEYTPVGRTWRFL